MNKNYPDYYKVLGLHNVTQIASRIFNIEKLSFPLNTIFHYIPKDHLDYFPGENLSVLNQSSDDSVYINYVDTLSTFVGNPRKNNINVKTMIQRYHKQHPNFKYLADISAKVPQGKLEVLNYGILEAIWNYQNNQFSPYQRWLNIEKTYVEKIKQVIQSSKRQNFRFIEIPTVIPSFNSLENHTKIDSNTLVRFNSTELLTLLDIWKWLSTDKNTQLDSTINSFSQEEIKNINYVFFHKNHFSLINLSKFREWNRDYNEEGDYNTGQIKKFFLSMLIDIQTVNSGTQQNINKDNLELSEIKTSDPDSVKIVSDEEGELPIENTIEETIDTRLDNKIGILNTIEEMTDNQKVTTVQYDSRDDLITDILKPSDLRETLKNDIVVNNVFLNAMPGEVQVNLNKLENLNKFKSPYDPKLSVEDYIKVPREDIEINEEETLLPDSKFILDKSMLKCSTLNMDKKYITKVLDKHKVACILAIQRGGFIIEKYEIERDLSLLGDYETHSIQIKPIKGLSSKINIKIPRVSEDGEFKASGNTYRMKAQRVDIPIRKIDKRTVVLTTYYGKLFIERSDKRKHDEEHWLHNYLVMQSLMMEDPTRKVLKAATSNSFDNKQVTPKIFSTLSSYFRNIVLNISDDPGIDNLLNLWFTPSDLETLFQKEVIDAFNVRYKDNYTLIGRNKDDMVCVDYNDHFWLFDSLTLEPLKDLGNIYSILTINPNNAPMPQITMTVFNKKIPIVIILGLLMGINNIIKVLKLEDNLHDIADKKLLNPKNLNIEFSDKIISIERSDRMAILVMSALLPYAAILKKNTLNTLNDKSIYNSLLLSDGIGIRYMKEIDTLERLYLDPITIDILEILKEPVTFTGLVIRACNMLLLDNHPDLNDSEYQRDRGYERVAGAIYKQLVLSIRDFNLSNIRGKSKLKLHPYAVWSNVTQDNNPAVKIVSDINPLEKTKEVDVVTFVGEGGRSKETMNMASRTYSESDIGKISEATVDSGDVGVNIYRSGNPKYNTLYGLHGKFDMEKDGVTSLFSTSAIMSVGSLNDDVKRINFIQIQLSHMVACNGYEQPIVRTGYEYQMAYRAGKKFAYMAEQDGKVISLNDKGIIVEYPDGNRVGVSIGRTYGASEGTTYPHDIITFLKEGDTFKKGDPIAYHSGFFERDWLDKSKIIMKSSTLLRTLFVEGKETYEDSSAVSLEASKKLVTKVTVVKTFPVDFKHGIINMVKVGTKLTPDMSLFILEDELTAERTLTPEDIEGLERFSKTPKAKTKGIVDKIKVIYNGNPEDMSTSLNAITLESDKELKRECISTNNPVLTGRVTEEYRVNGKSLLNNKAVIMIYITKEVNTGIGDKGVFGNQMKSVLGDVFRNKIETIDGEVIDSKFSQRSNDNRIITSLVIMGQATTNLLTIEKKAVALYKQP